MNDGVVAADASVRAVIFYRVCKLPDSLADDAQGGHPSVRARPARALDSDREVGLIEVQSD